MLVVHSGFSVQIVSLLRTQLAGDVSETEPCCGKAGLFQKKHIRVAPKAAENVVMQRTAVVTAQVNMGYPNAPLPPRGGNTSADLYALR